MKQITESALVQGNVTPTSTGALELFGEAEASDTLPDAGGLRLDYVLPSVAGIDVEQTAVFWPGELDPLRHLAGGTASVSSDHRLVWADLTLTGEAADDGSERSGTSSGGGGATDISALALLLALTGLLAGRRRRR
jgi:MYXO-CTERM domain-containing protein